MITLKTKAADIPPVGTWELLNLDIPPMCPIAIHPANPWLADWPCIYLSLCEAIPQQIMESITILRNNNGLVALMA